jgi:hypothetical protein
MFFFEIAEAKQSSCRLAKKKMDKFIMRMLRSKSFSEMEAGCRAIYQHPGYLETWSRCLPQDMSSSVCHESYPNAVVISAAPDSAVYADWLADSLHIFVQNIDGKWIFGKFTNEGFVVVNGPLFNSPFQALDDYDMFEWFANTCAYNHHPSARCFRTLLVGLDAYPKSWPKFCPACFISPQQLEGLMDVAKSAFHTVMLSKYKDMWMVKQYSNDLKTVEAKLIATLPSQPNLFYIRDVAQNKSQQFEKVGDVVIVENGKTATVVSMTSERVTFSRTTTAVPLKSICNVLHHSLGTRLVVSRNDITSVLKDYFAAQTLEFTINAFDTVENLQFVVVPKPKTVMEQ